MLDLQRHAYCPIWADAVQPTEASHTNATTAQQWTGLKHACQKVLQTYCKLFEKGELYDLIVRYMLHYKQKTNTPKNYPIHTHTTQRTLWPLFREIDNSFCLKCTRASERLRRLPK